MMDEKPTKKPTDMELMKEKALEQFGRRRRYAAQIERIDNAGLHAGQPMYFYCKTCNIPTEVLPEDYLFTPISLCSQCQGMKDEGWLDEAMKMKE
jgi:hypothetical protein